ncbi:hypothetical protein IFM89_001490 [Coptis chinensis]|uniref:Uncharacterized protein n=1 Tax=Coptis chinensis TaxID=261450 RepID=A0A835HC59_9MAGN|nr:hypothetical protein IFM89_001490 [Coptis chinensis]
MRIYISCSVEHSRSEKYPHGEIPPASGMALFISLCVGLLGSGYVLYKLYNGHRQRLLDLERELEPYPIVTNFFKQKCS